MTQEERIINALENDAKKATAALDQVSDKQEELQK